MRIGIDATAALRESAGIGRYTRGLIQALGELSHPHELVLVHTGDVRAIPSWAERFPRIQLPFSERSAAWLWHRLGVPLKIERWTGALDVFHGPNFTLPPLAKAYGVSTIHDLAFLRPEPWHSPRLKRYLGRAVRKSLERSDHIIADSESTKADMLKHFPVKAEKVTVVYPGISPIFHPVSQTNALRRAVQERYAIEPGFLLSVGTLEPRKNFSSLITALSQIPDASVKLLIVGKGGWLGEEETLKAKIRSLKLENRVRLLGFVPDEDLVVLHHLARLFVYPSLYEGFGFPVLEAMACGLPVITSRLSSLKEAGGTAAHYVEDPSKPEQLAAAITAVLSDPALERKLGTEGLEHRKRFTWESAAQNMLKVYERGK